MARGVFVSDLLVFGAEMIDVGTEGVLQQEKTPVKWRFVFRDDDLQLNMESGRKRNHRTPTGHKQTCLC